MLIIKEVCPINHIVVKTINQNDRWEEVNENAQPFGHPLPFVLQLDVPHINVVSYYLAQHNGKVVAQITVNK